MEIKTEKPKIKSVSASEIIDSRGFPTVEARVLLSDGSHGRASVPSGASTGKYEAHEKRDGDRSRFGGKGVLSAVESVNGDISKILVGTEANQEKADRAMTEADGTENKSRFGANAVLAVSLALAKASAQHYRLPLFRYLGGINAKRLPVPMMNILNGGAHASNNLDVQEFMIMPVDFPSFSEALRAGCEIYRALQTLLKSEGKSVAVGDEGGFAPDLNGDTEALDLICSAIEKAGYYGKVKIALDVAASEWATEDGDYYMPKAKRKMTTGELIEHYEKLLSLYPIVSIEDGLGEDDREGWKQMTAKLGKSVALVGDDLFVTNLSRVKSGVANGIANAVLIKPNQIGTLTETMAVVRYAAEHSYRCILSHRSGETEDTTVADIAVATNCGYVKFGAPCRSERLAKYNRLLNIEKCIRSK